MVPPKRPLSNDPNSSVYFGYGCFWHAQYDMFMVERAEFSPPRREDSKITSLVGYAGGLYTSEDGLVCYHGGPRGSLYSDNGHAEVVQVQLDSGHEPAQFTETFAAAQQVADEDGFPPPPDDAQRGFDVAAGLPVVMTRHGGLRVLKISTLTFLWVLV